VFGIYRNAEASHHERGYALAVLKTIATPEQRIAIKEDLVSGLLTTNELIASALPAVDWQGMSVEQLIAVFRTTQSEGGYGTGPMARALKEDMLPETSASTAEVLLQAVLEHYRSLNREAIRTISRFGPARTGLVIGCAARLLRALAHTIATNAHQLSGGLHGGGRTP